MTDKNKIIWHPKTETPKENEWILCKLITSDDYPQPYKVWRFSGHDGLVTGNYPKSDWTFCNYGLAPILEWTYLKDLEKFS